MRHWDLSRDWFCNWFPFWTPVVHAGYEMRAGNREKRGGRWGAAEKASVVRGSMYLVPQQRHPIAEEDSPRWAEKVKGGFERVTANCCLHNSAIWSSEISGACNSENHSKARFSAVTMSVCLAWLYFTKLFVSEQQEAMNATSYLYNMFLKNCFSPSTYSLLFSHFCKKERKKSLPKAGAPQSHLLPAQSVGVCR